MRRVRNVVEAFDVVTAKTIGRLPKQWYDFFSYVGLIVRPGLWIGVALVSGLLFLVEGLSGFAFLGFATAVLVPVSTMIKLLFRRQRPITIYTQAMRIKSYSFPSSHSYSAALVATFLSICALYFTGAWAALIIGVLAMLVITVAVSRVFVGAHYPSDVIGGALLGVMIQLVTFMVWYL